MSVKHTIREKAGKTATTQRPDPPRCVSVVVLVGILSSVSMCLGLLDPFFFLFFSLCTRMCGICPYSFLFLFFITSSFFLPKTFFCSSSSS